MLGLRVRGRGGRDRTCPVAAPISAFLWGSTPFLCARAKKWGGTGRAGAVYCLIKRRTRNRANEVLPCLWLGACAPLRWEVVVGLPCDSTPFLWCLPKETVSSRQRKALFYPGGSTIRVSAAGRWTGRSSPDFCRGWCLSGGSTAGQARASTFMRALHAGAKKAPSGRTGLLSIKGRPWPSRTGR